MSRVASIGLASMLVGCVLPRHIDVPESALSDELLSGVAVFGEVVSADEVPDSSVLALDDAMRAFVVEHVGDTGNSVARFRRLLNSLTSQGYFTDSYDAGKTNSAIDTFHTRSGNCLSFTNLFVALGREARLNTVYQIVDVPPSWDADNGYLIRFTHINVVIKGVRNTGLNAAQYTLDFNDVVPDPGYRRYEVSDSYAQALFYGNLSVAELRNGEVRKSFAFLKKAIELEPRNQDMWINLGAFFASQKANVEALRAYQIALGLRGTSKSAMSGIARSFQAIGEEELAAPWAAKVRRYRLKNPFYHFAVAQAEFQSSNYALAIRSIDKAIDLKGRNPRFHLLKGLAEQKLGDSEAARKSFNRAKRYGKSDLHKSQMRQDLLSLMPG